MTATQEIPAVGWERRHVFHSDGVRNVVAETEEQFDRLMVEGCWHLLPQEPPPPPPPPMTPEEQAAVTQSELEGLGDQVDAQAQLIGTLEERANSASDALVEIHARIDGVISTATLSKVDTEARILKLEQSRAGASGVTVAFQDRLNTTDKELAGLKESMDQAGQALAEILRRLDSMETKKGGK